MLNADKFKRIFPKADHSKWFIPMMDELKQIDITDKGLACFLATLYIESNGLTVFVENLNYSTEGLYKTFPTRFYPNTKFKAEDYAKQPEKIANMIYGERMGNNIVGDGWKYRGRGVIQLTGKNNYIKYGNILALPLATQPDMILNPMISIRVALEYFKQTKCWGYANAGDIKSVSGIVNAGSASAKRINHLDERTDQYLRILSIIKE